MGIRNIFQHLFNWIFGKKPEEPKGTNFLVVCTGNTCRSPMAAAILNFIKSEDTEYGMLIGEVQSAGLSVHEHAAAENAVEIAGDYGVDLTKHIPTQLNQDLVDQAGIILAMNANDAQMIRVKFDAKGRVMMMSSFGESSGPVTDPYGAPVETYHATAKQMERFLRRGLEEMANDSYAAKNSGSH